MWDYFSPVQQTGAVKEGSLEAKAAEGDLPNWTANVRFKAVYDAGLANPYGVADYFKLRPGVVDMKEKIYTLTIGNEPGSPRLLLGYFDPEEADCGTLRIHSHDGPGSGAVGDHENRHAKGIWDEAQNRACDKVENDDVPHF